MTEQEQKACDCCEKYTVVEGSFCPGCGWCRPVADELKLYKESYEQQLILKEGKSEVNEELRGEIRSAESRLRELAEYIVSCERALKEKEAQLCRARQAGEQIDVVFDGPPSHESGRFVEVENSEGKSILFGEWLQRSDGYWVLRFRAALSSSRPCAHEEEAKRLAVEWKQCHEQNSRLVSEHLIDKREAARLREIISRHEVLLHAVNEERDRLREEGK